MFFKDPLSLLAECAASDMGGKTETAIKESQVRSGWESIEEAAEPVYYAPEMVPVVKIGDDFLTEMQYLAPYIQNNGIATVAEALDNIAEANNLPAKSIGLLVESQDYINKIIDEALEKSGKGSDKILGKIKKGEGLIDKLKSKGYKVKKKKSVKEGCGGCKNKPSNKNEEGVNTGSQAPGENVDDTTGEPSETT